MRVSAHNIKRALQKQLSRERNGASRAWAVFEELRFGTGFAGYGGKSGSFEESLRCATTIDVFAICTWPSRNYLRRAYEIKVDRGDLKRELDNPDKRAPWLEIVNEFLIVVPKGLTTVAEINERAPDCGLVFYDSENQTLRTVRPPMQLSGGEPTWRLVASILRAASGGGMS